MNTIKFVAICGLLNNFAWIFCSLQASQSERSDADAESSSIVFEHSRDAAERQSSVAADMAAAGDSLSSSQLSNDDKDAEVIVALPVVYIAFAPEAF
jgi:hypothetical protein